MWIRYNIHAIVYLFTATGSVLLVIHMAHDINYYYIKLPYLAETMHLSNKREVGKAVRFWYNNYNNNNGTDSRAKRTDIA